MILSCLHQLAGLAVRLALITLSLMANSPALLRLLSKWAIAFLVTTATMYSTALPVMTTSMVAMAKIPSTVVMAKIPSLAAMVTTFYLVVLVVISSQVAMVMINLSLLL